MLLVTKLCINILKIVAVWMYLFWILKVFLYNTIGKCTSVSYQINKASSALLFQETITCPTISSNTVSGVQKRNRMGYVFFTVFLSKERIENTSPSTEWARSWVHLKHIIYELFYWSTAGLLYVFLLRFYQGFRQSSNRIQTQLVKVIFEASLLKSSLYVYQLTVTACFICLYALNLATWMLTKWYFEGVCSLKIQTLVLY